MKTKSTLLAFARPRVLWGLGISSFVAIILISFPPLSAWATQVASVMIGDDSPKPPFATITMSTSTPGAIIFFKTSHTGFPSDPTHSGSTPTNGTSVYNHSFTVPYGEGYNDPDSILYIKAIAYKSGFTDSVVSTDVCDNRGQ